MTDAAHLDPKLALVTIACLLAAWGLVFAAIAVGIASGLRAARNDRSGTARKSKSPG
jgi:hypothetical protein